MFAWKLADMKSPGMTYTMIDVGQGTGGGMMKKPMPGPTMWLPYVEVDSVKKTIAKAAAGGAQIALDFMEIEGGMGAIGMFVDPTGAMIGVWEAAKKTAKKAPKKAAKKATKKKSKRK